MKLSLFILLISYFCTFIYKLLVFMKPCGHLFKVDDTAVRAEPVLAVYGRYCHVFAFTTSSRSDLGIPAFFRMSKHDIRPFFPDFHMVFFYILNFET